MNDRTLKSFLLNNFDEHFMNRFLRMLKDNDLFRKFVRNYNNDEENFDYSIKKTFLGTYGDDYFSEAIFNAFNWATTKEGSAFWNKIYLHLYLHKQIKRK